MLQYAEIAEPDIGTGDASHIVPGVKWLKMPLGGRLAAINIWLLDNNDDSASVVDTGIRSADSLNAWLAIEQGILKGRKINRVLITHMHPDHSGMAGWLNRHHGAQLHMTPLEFFVLRYLTSAHESAPETALSFYRAAGMEQSWLDQYQLRFGSFSNMIWPLPDQLIPLDSGKSITIGDIEWSCVLGYGHSPEHACFWSRDHKLFISGDQVLPTISSNVSVYPYMPEADPLTGWLNSLAEIRKTVPNDVLVLPAHGRPFHGLHERIDAMVADHEEDLERLHSVLEVPHRAVDVFVTLFGRPITNETVRLLAAGEAMAHLHCLRTRGLARSYLEDGITWWERA